MASTVNAGPGSVALSPLLGEPASHRRRLPAQHWVTAWYSGFPALAVTAFARLASNDFLIELNLLNDAGPFGDSESVGLRVQQNQAAVVFQRSDAGPGIAAEHLVRSFEPFTQVDRSTARQKGGAGLGLPVGRPLAYSLGDELLVESEIGKGGTFTLRRPVQTRSK